MKTELFLFCYHQVRKKRDYCKWCDDGIMGPGMYNKDESDIISIVSSYESKEKHKEFVKIWLKGFGVAKERWFYKSVFKNRNRLPIGCIDGQRKQTINQ